MLLILLTVVAFAYGQQGTPSVKITITPKAGVLGQPGEQTIRCEAVGVNQNAFSEIKLEKGGILMSSANGLTQAWGPGASISLRARAKISGSLSTEPFFGQITITKRDCSDAGMYQCTMDLRTVKNTLTSNQTLIYTAWPGLPKISMPKYPAQGIDPKQPRKTAAVGQQVSMTCSGDVGDPPVPFIWLRKRATDTDFIKFTKGVTNEPATKSVTSTCLYKGLSKLTYTVEAKDKNLQLKCTFAGDYTNSTTGTERTINIKTYINGNSATISPSTNGVSMAAPAAIHVLFFVISCVLTVAGRSTCHT